MFWSSVTFAIGEAKTGVMDLGVRLSNRKNMVLAFLLTPPLLFSFLL